MPAVYVAERTVEVTPGSPIVATAEVIAAMGNRSIIMDLRQSFLAAVEQLERAVGISPTTAEIRAAWKRQQCIAEIPAEMKLTSHL